MSLQCFVLVGMLLWGAVRFWSVGALWWCMDRAGTRKTAKNADGRLMNLRGWAAQVERYKECVALVGEEYSDVPPVSWVDGRPMIRAAEPHGGLRVPLLVCPDGKVGDPDAAVPWERLVGKISSTAPYAHLVGEDWDGVCVGAMQRDSEYDYSVLAGDRCRVTAVRGAVTCRSHGGSSMLSKERRKQAVAEAEVASAWAELATPVVGVTPLELFQIAVEASAGRVLSLQSRVREIDDEDPALGMWVALLRQAERDAADIAAKAAKAGLDESRERERRKAAELAVAVIRELYSRMELSPEQVAMWPVWVEGALSAVEGLLAPARRVELPPASE